MENAKTLVDKCKEAYKEIRKNSLEVFKNVSRRGSVDNCKEVKSCNCDAGNDNPQDFIRLVDQNVVVNEQDREEGELNCYLRDVLGLTSRPISLGASKIRLRLEYRDKKLDEFKVVSMLGVGSFGKVQLVQDEAKPERVYALKVLLKANVVRRSQQQHVMNEKRILIGINSPFIIQLYKTFRDDRYVYLLMEVCLGGELWTKLRDDGRFDETTARFYAACVVEALDYLHERSIAYRDLKPENLLMDARGYVKLIDFGFAKLIGSSGKTKTLCGTPEYVAPEVILDEGHDCSVDFWSLGILIYELSTGYPPFTNSEDTLELYQEILDGFDTFKFSKHVTDETKSIIKKLCKQTPKERLGAQRAGFMGIRRHKFFKGFHWLRLQNRTMQPPFRPKIENKLDTSNFDECDNSEDEEDLVDEFSGWDEYFGS